MKQDQEQKCHICRFCKQSFSNGRKLGGHMRRHLALISASRQMGVQETIHVQKGIHVSDDQENFQENVQENDEEMMNDVMVKKSQQEMDVDQDCKANNNVYVLRENPKRSWRVSNLNKGFQSLKVQKRCNSRKELVKDNSVCEKCGKSFNSVKALYGHMRCHSMKRSRLLDSSSFVSSSEDHQDADDDEVATAVRKKRTCTRYKSPKPNHDCGSSLSCSSDAEVEKGAICLMMLSMGLRDLDEGKMVISRQAEFGFSDSGYVKFEVVVDGSMEMCELKKDLVFRSGSGQLNTGQSGSTHVKYKPPKNPISYDQDFGEMNATDSGISLELKRMMSKQEYGSGRALGSQNRILTS